MTSVGSWRCCISQVHSHGALTSSKVISGRRSCVAHASSPARRSPGPVFVGGTGRSGTGIVARLIATHGSHAIIPAEIRFHADPGGLVDLVAGKVELDWFLHAMRYHWFAERRLDGKAPGLRRICPEDRFHSALGVFEAAFPSQPLTASRELVHALLDPVTAQAESAHWVEHTPTNLAAASGLARLFPEGTFIHCVRSGVDVACSVADQSWGPDNAIECLFWWHDRFRAAAIGERAVGANRVHRVNLERLVGDDRDREYEDLANFLGLGLAGRAFLDREVVSSRAHIARWRQDIPATELAAFQGTARLVSRRLDSAGLSPPMEATLDTAPINNRVRIATSLRALRWACWRGRRWHWRRTRRRRLGRRLRTALRRA